MGFSYGQFRYGQHKYSYLADWWQERPCENDKWTERVCATPVWAGDQPSLINQWLVIEGGTKGHTAPVDRRQIGFKPARPG